MKLCLLQTEQVVFLSPPAQGKCSSGDRPDGFLLLKLQALDFFLVLRGQNRTQYARRGLMSTK